MVLKSMYKSVVRYFHKGRLRTELRGKRSQVLRSRLCMESLEERNLMAVLPTPLIDNQTALTAGFDPMLIIDPTDTDHLLAVYTTGGTIGMIESTNGGDSWSGNLFTVGKLIDPNILGLATQYAQATDPTIAMDRNEMVYVSWLEHDATNNSGTFRVAKFDFSGFGASVVDLTPTTTAGDPTQILYRWVGQDAIYNPYIAIDNNLPTFTDPITGHTQVDTTVGELVYVAWNTNAKTPTTFINPNDPFSTAPGAYNPNEILVSISGDGGLSFTTPQLVSASGDSYSGTIQSASPIITFPQGDVTVEGDVTGGQLTFVWSTPGGAQVDRSLPVAGELPDVREYSNNTNVNITEASIPADDAPQGTPDGNTTRTSTITVNDPDDANFVLADLDVTIALYHPHLNQLRIRLTAPDGTVITLVQRGVDGLGNAQFTFGNGAFPEGMPDTANMGIIDFGAGQNPQLSSVGTVFDQDAPRRINDRANVAPYIAHFRPETILGNDLDDLNGLTMVAGELKGDWVLSITDFRDDDRSRDNPPPIQFLDSWSLKMVSNVETDGYGTDDFIPTVGTVGFAANETIPYPTGGAISPFTGIGPGIVAAYDNTLGSFSPYQGRLYVAYTGGGGTNTNVFVTHSDDGGATWSAAVQINDDSVSDNFSEGTRHQFMPTIAVDQTTGTLVATWYDARFDASNARPATYIATSIDGGDTWSQNTFLNIPKQATDVITGQVITIEPMPNNIASAGALGFGDSQGLVVHNGRVTPLWSGNLNAGGASLWTADTFIAAGPRVVYGDMGPVIADFQANALVGNTTYNNTFLLSDGRRQLNGFEVRFDRPIDPGTFGIDDVKIMFRSPTDTSLTGTDISNQVLSIERLNSIVLPGGTYGSRFLVHIAPQSATGTYSYSVGPNIRDGIRRVGAVITPVTPTAPFNAPFVSTDIPKAITDFATALSTITVPALPPGQIIAKVTVQLNITHTYDADLEVTLISPSGKRVLLVADRAPGGFNFTNTIFDDAAATAIGSGSAPFTGTFRPEELLAFFNGDDANGTWTLEVFDDAGADTGTLNSWSITITPGVASAGFGNVMDQDNDGTAGEANVDAFAVPNPTNDVPFVLPYETNTLPLILTGPYVVSNTTTLQLNGTTNYVDVTFDRDILAESFTRADLISLVGPGGPIDLTNATVTAFTALTSRTFRITFPTQFLNGAYSLLIGPNIEDTTGDRLDINHNAGVDVLRGESPTAKSFTTNNYNQNTSVKIEPGKTVVSTIDVGEAFVIQPDAAHPIQVRLNINYPNDPDLQADLVAPDGTRIRLFTAVGFLGSDRANFTNTVFDDFAAVLIKDGTAPFNTGPYKPQQPLSNLIGHSAQGQWRLEITNTGTSALATNALTDWSLFLPRAVPGTGLGEATADRFTVNFRIFTQDPTQNVSSDMWTQVGAQPQNIDPGLGGPLTGRVSAIVVDPSDTSGNTVFVGGGSGGVWKTTNFLTTSANGPTWIPLTDLGPTNSLNTSSIALIPRNNDPSQTIVFVATGEGNLMTPGVGFLRSLDGGKTWDVIDSTNQNFDSTTGTSLFMSSPLRNHAFVGSTAFKVVVDPTPLPSGSGPGGLANYAIYAAVSGPNGGIWRSLDTGNTWVKLGAGAANNATDVVLAPGSVSPSGNLQVLYAAYENSGVYMTQNAFNPVAPTLGLMAGGAGADYRSNGAPIPVNNNNINPNGNQGRIVLATPQLTGNPAQDAVYKDWLYALVENNVGVSTGLYVTKDRGLNWTLVQLPLAPNNFNGTNDESRVDVDVAAASLRGGQPIAGDFSMTMTVDPTNANILYLAGATRIIRVDLTTLSDLYTLVGYDESDPNVGAQQHTATRGPAVVTGPGYGLVDPATGNITGDYFNLITRNPDNPFFQSASLQFAGVASWDNLGDDAHWMPFGGAANNAPFQHHIFAVADPLTGGTRVIYANDWGVYTDVDRGDGRLTSGIGTAVAVSGNRIGNLQLGEFISGAVQPSALAAQLAGSLFYAASLVYGTPMSDSDLLTTGQLDQSGLLRGGYFVATAPSGTGEAFRYIPPSFVESPFVSTDFFQYLRPGANDFINNPNQRGVEARVGGALNTGTFATGANRLLGSSFALNNFDPTAIVMSDRSGRVFLTTDDIAVGTGKGVDWRNISGSPGYQLDGSYVGALAFGAPAVNSLGNKSSFIYAGTTNGNVFVTRNGGGTWTNLNAAGLDGSTIQSISARPLGGSGEVYVMTEEGLYWMADSSVVGATWTKLMDTTTANNPFQLQRPIFNEAGDTQTTLTAASLSAMAIDWRYDIPDTTGTGKHPVLYVAGTGGVFRSIDKGESWRYFPNVSNDTAVQEEGYLPNVEITDLDLSLGSINPATGLPEQTSSGGLNLLLATTFGRGQFAIRLDNTDVQQYQIVPAIGPQVTRVVNTNEAFGTNLQSIEVTFSGPVDPSTFTLADILTLRDPSGNIITPTSVTDITVLPPAPSVGQQPATYQSVFRISFTATPQTAAGFYRLSLGVDISDYGGNKLNQDGDTINGEVNDIYDSYFFYRTDVTINEDTSTGALPFVAGTSGITSIVGTSDNQTLVPNANIVETLSTINVTPGANQFGTATITVTASNGTLTYTGTYKVRVNSVNDAPTLTLPPASSITLPTTVMGPLAFTVGDVETPLNSLTITAVSNNQAVFPNAGIVLGGTGANRTITLTSTGVTGAAIITVTVTDGNGTSTIKTFAVQVQGNAPFPVTDNFTRADNPFMGPIWNENVGNFDVVSNAAQSLSPVSLGSLRGLTVADVAVSATINVNPAPTGQQAGLILRYGGSGDANYYMGSIFYVNGVYTAYIYRNQGGVFTELSVRTVANGTGTLRFEAIGTSLKLFLNDTLVGFANDSTFAGTSGTSTVGVRSFGIGTTFDDFNAGPLGSTTGLPFTDDYSTDVVRQQLQDEWTNQAGNFNVAGGIATSNAVRSLATLNMTNVADVAVQASIAIGANSGQQVGLISRYTGTGDSNYYIGFITGSGGVFTANIYSNIGGNFTLLDQRTVPGSGTLTGTLRFETVGTSLKLFVGNTLVAFANDASLTTGKVGIRAFGAGSTFDDFSATTTTVGTPATLPFPALNTPETFDTSTRQQLQSTWTDQAGNFLVNGGVATNNANRSLATINIANTADVAVEVSFSLSATGDKQAGLVTRYSGTGDTNYYLGFITGSGGAFNAQIYRNVGGNFVLLDQRAVAGSGTLSGTLRFETVGTSLKLFVGNTLVAFANDSVLTTGKVGMRAFGAGVALDNFYAEAVGATATLPFPALNTPETFDTSTRQQLQSTWTDQAGNFLVNGGVATNNANRSLATINIANTADVAVEVSFSLSATGDKQAGLVTRYSGTGDTNYYLGFITGSGGAFNAQIYRNVGGNFVLLDQRAVAGSGTLSGTLRFETVGTSLKLFVGNTLVAFANDSVLTTGKVGMRAFGAGVALDNFYAEAVGATATLPFPALNTPETFDTSTRQQLQSTWTDQAGNFLVNGGVATNNANRSLATINIANTADVAVEVSFSLSATGDKQAGLVTRYSGTGDTNYYLGFITGSGGAFNAQIYRNVGGNFVLLDQRAVAGSGTLSGTLRFETVGTSLKLFVGNTLVAFANDSVLTTGKVGMRAFGAGVALDNFYAEVPTTSPASLTFNDDFTTAGPRQQLQNTWTDQVGNYLVNGGVATSNATRSLATINIANTADVAVQATISLSSTGDKQAGLVTRYGGAGDTNYYLGFITGSGGAFNAQIYRNVGGNFVLLDMKSVAGTGTLTGTLRFETIGSSLKLFLNDQLIAFAQDTAITTGKVGMRAFGTGVTFDSFNATTLSSSTANLTFNDGFATVSGDRQQLQNTWTDQVGNYRVNGGVATSNATRSLATINMANTANVAVQAAISVSAFGDTQAGLVTRYGGAGDTNYYLGFITGSGGAFNAQIYRNVGGNFVLLDMKSVAGTGTLTGTLRFETIGSSLKLFLNDQLIAFAQDTAITTGKVGMRAFGTGITFDSFNATTLSSSTATLTFNDGFATVSGDRQQLQNTWTDQVGNYRVAGGFAISNAAISLATINMANTANVAAQTAISIGANSGQQVGLVSRYTGNGDANFYFGSITGSGGAFTANIYRNVGGVVTLLDQRAVAGTGTLTGTLRFETIGTSLRLYFNDALISFTNDTALTTGKVGIRAVGAGLSVDNFNATTLGSTATLTYTESFNTIAGDRQQLRDSWTNQVGNYRVTGGVATNNANLSLATINMADTANVIVQASISIGSFSNQQVGLVARYTGTGDANYYVAYITGSGGVYNAHIYRNVGGVFTLLDMQTVSGPGVLTGNLRFDVSGNSLQLRLDGNLIASATDSVLTTGKAGIRAVGATTFDNFSVS